ncbi:MULTISPECIES: rhamnogalacturonan lyase family protein [Niastella]|uniref:T9SS type A sorting domain-containing protein n=1 Tax=Niastella soli TaxID=2821487 RepID=A0ABS3YX71_9BACT|nr:T9SS type A sorting domain-containing protein [Niastella soli]MBO9202493.1 T9SS type A sorting domain-containing protein [Niastella soli]
MKKMTCLLWMPIHTGKACPKKAAPFRTPRSGNVFLPFFMVILLLLLAGVSHAQQWQVLGNEQAVTAAASSYTTIVLVSEGGADVPYVAFTESGVGKVKKQQSDGSWAQVGNNLSTGSTSYTRIYTDHAGALYVTYMDRAAGNRLAIKRYNAATDTWQPLGDNSANLYVSAGSVNNGVSQYSSTPRSSLVFDSNHMPYIAFGDNGNLVPFVKKFDNGAWVTVGDSSVSSAGKAVAMSLVIDENEVLWLAYCSLASNTATTGSLALYKYNGSAWTAVTAAISGIRHTSMALNAAGNLTIAYFNTGNSNKATIITYDKSVGTWSSSTALSGRDAPGISLIRDNSGNLYCSFIDAVSSTAVSAARVFKLFTGSTTWKELKDPAVATGIDQPVGNLGMAVGSDTASASIVYTKTSTAGFSTPVVRKFIPPPPPVTLTTTLVSNITTNSATGGGFISSDGGSPLTERGLVYSLSINPTIADNKVVAASADTGTYSVTLSNLTPATAYYVRAYAINAGGTYYGNNVRLSSRAMADAVVNTPKQMEYLTRAVVAMRRDVNTVYVGWRLLGTDPAGIAFNLYRDSIKVNAIPITNSTNYVDSIATNGTYFVRPVLNGVEGVQTETVPVWANNQLHIPLQIPPGGTTVDGVAYTYTANDCSVGDVDGDGVYEIFLKWDPTRLNHNSGGYSGEQIIDCYKLDGTRLWRINLGKNINAGPHFTQFMVYDFDGDGKAEMICKTADGTMDGAGVVIGDPLVDYRNAAGWVDKGPEFLTVFNGLTGKAMATINYEPARGAYTDWGDGYGNRAERYINAVAYLDGARPSVIIGRGYYNKLVRAAYDWRNGQLTLRWKFDSKDSTDAANNAYSGQGNHQMTIGDVDGDGKDEVISGSCAIDDDGTRLWTNRNGHGDALHMTDMDPDRPGQEIWICQENPNEYAPYGLRFNDAGTGETIFGIPTGSDDVGRALAADLDSAHRGYELWGSSGSGLYNVKGELISTKRPTYNHAVWWDGDLARELLDGNVLDKWRPDLNGSARLFTIYQAAPVTGNNDTKKNPCLTADLFGDWREEILLRYSDNTQLVLFTTNIPTNHRIYTLMHDPQYRTAVAWQNSGYNQPPHPSFFLGYDMQTPPMPNIELAKQEQTITFDTLGIKAYGHADFDPGAIATSGLKVEYVSSNAAVAAIVNGKVHLTGTGTTDIIAVQPGDNRYKAAIPQMQTLTVNDSTPPSQPQALTTVKALHEKVQLIWLASTDDIGVAGYYIYRDGIPLNTGPVSGTSFITDAPAGPIVYTYTVIAVDAAGNRSPESAPARFTNSNGHGGGNTSQEVLKIFPNPSDGNFKLRLNSQETGLVTIIISNTAGNVIQQLTDRKQGNLYQKEIRLKCPSKGMYLVQVVVGTFTQTAIVIIK